MSIISKFLLAAGIFIASIFMLASSALADGPETKELLIKAEPEYVRMGSTNAGIVIHMYRFDKSGSPTISVGTVRAENTPYGVMFIPNLTDIPVGPHGFHIHENPNCDNAGMAAGGHLDPYKTGRHRGPVDQSGHLGDLPYLISGGAGVVDPQHPVIAPRLALKDIIGHSLMLHTGGDNYSDTPSMGGGGARFVCGVIGKN